MSTVAQQLREGREARNLTIQQVADITKIRTDHLRALEEGSYDAFSAPVYIRGFVRSYSMLLKLEVPRLMTELEAELKQTRKFAEPPALSPRTHGVLDFIMLQLSQLDWRKALIAVAALGVALGLFSSYLAWKHKRAADPLKGLGPGLYQPGQGNSGDTLPLPAKR
jgi:cytoskeletal protein RodZ